MAKQLVNIGSAANDASGDELRVGAIKINDNFNEIYTGFGDGTTLNTTISLGGLTLSLGDTDATPAFDLSDATNYPTSSLVGTITNTQLAGSITNAKLVNPNILFRGDAVTTITQALGGTLQVAGGTGITTAVSGNTLTITNSGYGSSNFTTDLSGKTTTDLAEGTNLYYTDARADARAQLKIDTLIDSSPGALDTLNELAAAIGDDANFSTTITNSIATKLATSDFNSTFDPRFNTQLGTKDTDDLSEGTTNLYHTDARADARVDAGFTAKSTTNLSEGTNLYYTDARADARITNALIDEDNMVSDSATKLPSQQSVKAYVDSQILTKDNSDEIAEGSSNLYHTTARARSSISVSGDLSYNSSTGVVSFTQGNSDSITEGSSNLYHTDARAIAAVTGSDLDMGSNNITTTGQLLFKNMFATAADLPNATTYHGMFAHVHSVGKAYFAHAGNWVMLLDTTSSDTSDLSEGSNLYYTDARVDTHLNTGSASANEVLSWNGSDYAWVANSGGSGGTAITIQEEGTSLATAASTINFVGAGVTASGTGSTKTISISTVSNTPADVRTAVEAATDSNVFTDADHTKLNAIEASADVTDTANVVAALTAGSNITISAGGEIASTGGGSAITIQEEGSSLSTAATTINFVGAGVTATGTGATKTITIPTTPNMSDADIRTAVEAATDSNVFTDADHTKLNAIEANAKDELSGSEIKALYEAQSNTNAFTDAEQTKLGTVETNATADQTDAEIRTAVEAAVDSNVFTDADHTKLNAIEANADVTDTSNVVNALSAGTNISISAGGQISAAQIAITDVYTVGSESTQLALSTSQGDVIVRTDQNKTYIHNGGSAGTMADFTLLLTPTNGVTSVVGSTGVITAAQIKTAYEAINDTNEFTDAEKTKLGTVEQAATADQSDAEIRAAVEAATDSNVFTDADHTKLDGIEASATADQTDAEIRAAVEAATDSNVFTDADHTKLNAIEASATADQTDAEIRTAVEAATDSNVFTDADHTKLDGIEASADVTDTTNVVAALTAGSNITIAADGTIASSGGGGGSAITIQEEGSSLATAASTINFVGSGVTATGTGTTKTITVSGGATISSGVVSGTDLVLTKSDASTVTIDATSMVNGVTGVSTGNNWYYAFGDRANLNVNHASSNLAAGIAGRAPFYFGTPLTRGKEMRYTANPNTSHTMGIWDGAEGHAGTYHSWITDTNWSTGFKYIVNSGYLSATNTPLINNTNGSNRYLISTGDIIAIRFETDGHLTLLDQTGTDEVIISKTSVPVSSSITSLNIMLGCDQNFVFPNASIVDDANVWSIVHDFDDSEDGVVNGIEDHTVIRTNDSISPGQQFNINFNLVAQGDFFGTSYTGAVSSGSTTAEQNLTRRFQYQTNESFIGPDWNFNTSAANYFLPTGTIHSWRRIGVNNPQGMVSLRYNSDHSIELWSEVDNELIATAAAAGDGNPFHLFHGVKGNRTYAQIPGVTKSNIAATATGNADGMIIDFSTRSADFSLTAAQNYTAYLVDCSSNTVTATLPASPSQGQRIKFIDLNGAAATNNITIARNGNNINGAASNLTISTNRKTVEILFITGTGWIVSENP